MTHVCSIIGRSSWHLHDLPEAGAGHGLLAIFVNPVAMWRPASETATPTLQKVPTIGQPSLENRMLPDRNAERRKSMLTCWRQHPSRGSGTHVLICEEIAT